MINLENTTNNSQLKNLSILYIWQASYPWEIRVDKFCRSFLKQGAKVTVLARWNKGQAEHEEYQGINIIRVGANLPRFLTVPIPWNPIWRWKLRKIVQELNPKLIIAREIMLAEPAAQIAHLHGAKIYIDMAEHYPAAMRTWRKYSETFLARLLIHKIRIADWIEKKAVKAVDGILTVCEEQNERLKREYGIHPDCLIDIQNAPEPETYAKVGERSTKCPPTRFGYHGVIMGDRDLETVVLGFNIAAKANPQITLQISGDGESMVSIRQLYSESPFRDRIFLTGRYDIKDIHQILNDIDFGITSLKVNEFTEVTVANKFYEYALVGRPFIYVETHPMNRLMQTFQCGVSYKNGNPESVAKAMLEILNKDYLKMAQNGTQAVISRYNWETEAKRMIGFLKKQILS
jgi:glycosyltransferase involved in cell wall biosynthesis